MFAADQQIALGSDGQGHGGFFGKFDALMGDMLREYLPSCGVSENA